jgi:hypothetical protein
MSAAWNYLCTPRDLVAVWRSTLSMPMLMRPTTFSRPWPASSTSHVTLVLLHTMNASNRTTLAVTQRGTWRRRTPHPRTRAAPPAQPRSASRPLAPPASATARHPTRRAWCEIRCFGYSSTFVTGAGNDRTAHWTCGRIARSARTGTMIAWRRQAGSRWPARRGGLRMRRQP